MKTSEKIVQIISENQEISPRELTSMLGISERAVFKQLAKLVDAGKVSKIGKPPKVFYTTGKLSDSSTIQYSIDNKVKKVIEENFLYITPLGEYFAGISGFTKWCVERNLQVVTQANQYYEAIRTINKSRKNDLILSTAKFNKLFSDNALKEVFYIDFYSLPQFGKTKLGQLLLYAKQSQDKKRIKEVADISNPFIAKVIKQYKIGAIGFIPPTVKRETQFMKELENNLNFNLAKLKITKIKTDIIIPQKTLSKMEDRILNAKNTIILEDKRTFKNVLIIDDAVGSGATFNETAKKLIRNKIAQNVYGLAIAGSYKGFDIISEI